MPDKFAVDAEGRIIRLSQSPGLPASLAMENMVRSTLSASEISEILALPADNPVRIAYQAAQASVSSLVSGAGILARRGNRGMRIFGGRTATAFNDGGTAKTHHCVVSTALPFDGVQIVLAACNSGVAVPVTSAAVCPVASAADLNVSGGTWTAATFAGSASGSIPQRAGSSRRTYLVSDFIPVSSVDRSDGGAFPLLAIRAYLGTAGTYTLLGQVGGTDDFTNWATKPDGRIHVMRYADGDCVSTPASFASTTNRSTSPIVGVIYYARGRVVNVVGFGDSITEGRGTYLNEGWGFPACSAASNAGVAYEWSNLGWSGIEWENGAATPGGIRLNVADAISASLPIDVACMPVWSPNDFLNEAALTDAAMRTDCQQPVMRTVGALRDAGVSPVLWTSLPVNTSLRDYNAADARRRSWNAAMLASGLRVVDFASVVGGTVDGDGQMIPPAGSLPDGIHPGDSTNAALAAVMARELSLYR